jgi:hypothetical protein
MVNKGAIGSLGALAALALLLAAGCGGGDETQSKAEFVRDGNAICAEWQQARGDRFQEIPSKLKPPVTQAEREKAILFLLEPYGDALDALKELDPPAGDEKKVEAMIKAADEAFAQGKGSPGTLISSNGGFNKSNELFDDYGLKACKV